MNEEQIKKLAREAEELVCGECISSAGILLDPENRMGFIIANTIRKAMANEIEEAEERRQLFRRIMDEECPSDEKHCTCVPHLRVGVQRLEAQLRVARKALKIAALTSSVARDALVEIDEIGAKA